MLGTHKKESRSGRIEMAPLGRIIAQVIVPIIATLARALPAAYAQAVQNAKKGGVDSTASAATAFARKVMSKEEAMMVLNVTSEKEVTAEIVEKQFQRYFAANSMEKGGSFYLQSKVYRAKEMLDQFIQEQQQQDSNKDETNMKH